MESYKMGTCVPGFPSAPSGPGGPSKPCEGSTKNTQMQTVHPAKLFLCVKMKNITFVFSLSQSI